MEGDTTLPMVSRLKTLMIVMYVIYMDNIICFVFHDNVRYCFHRY